MMGYKVASDVCGGDMDVGCHMHAQSGKLI